MSSIFKKFRRRTSPRVSQEKRSKSIVTTLTRGFSLPARKRTRDATPSTETCNEAATIQTYPDESAGVTPLDGTLLPRDAARGSSKFNIQGGEFPGSSIGQSIESQTVVHNKYRNCTTVVHNHFHMGSPSQMRRMISSGTFGGEHSATFGTSSIEMEGSPPSGQSSITDVIEESSSYEYLGSDITICKQPLRKGTMVFGGKQILAGAEHARRDVAVKIVHASKNNAKEAEFLIKLTEHQNIVRILQAGKCAGPANQIFLVMELCSKNLSEYVAENRTKPFSFPKTAAFAKQFISGLMYIHKKKVVHGNLKPDNILFSFSGDYLKISGFGMSKDKCHGQSDSGVSETVTDGFRAPELYASGSEATYKSDMFSFGIILFFLFTNGEHPFGEDPNDWSYNIRNKTEHPDYSSLPLVHNTSSPKSSQLLKLLRRTIKKKPTSRLASDEAKKHPFFKGVSRDSEAVRASHPNIYIRAQNPHMSACAVTIRKGRADEMRCDIRRSYSGDVFSATESYSYSETAVGRRKKRSATISGLRRKFSSN